MYLTPPTFTTLFISLIIAGLAIAMPYLPVHIPVDRVAVLAIGYVVLLAGNIIRGI